MNYSFEKTSKYFFWIAGIVTTVGALPTIGQGVRRSTGERLDSYRHEERLEADLCVGKVMQSVELQVSRGKKRTEGRGKKMVISLQ
jgi:hypothetical protein